MKKRLRNSLLQLLEPKTIILGFALFNVILIWIEARRLATGGIACVVCPWYDPWSYTNEPSILLIAAAFLWLSRKWSYLLALGLSGYLWVYATRLFLISGGSLKQEWAYLQEFEPYLVGSWDSQFILAFVISCFSAFYLARAVRKEVSRRSAANKALQLTAR
jgi:hypothetical protein